MSGRGAWIEADRQERLDRNAAAKRVLADRAAERVAVRELVEGHGLLNELGQPCSWSIQAALQLRSELGPDRVTRSMVVAAANENKRRVHEWCGRGAKERRAA